MTCPGGHILFAHVKLAAAELHACVNLQKLYLAKKDHWSATRVTPQAGREPVQSEIRSLSSLQCRQAGAVQSQRPPAHLPCAAVRAFRTSGGAVFRALEEAFGVRMHKLCGGESFLVSESRRNFTNLSESPRRRSFSPKTPAILSP